MAGVELTKAFTKLISDARAALSVPGAAPELSVTGKVDTFLESVLPLYMPKTAPQIVQQTSTDSGVPDFRINEGNELLGWVELKAVTGKTLTDLKGHDKDQRDRFVAGLHNVILTTGWQWELYQDGTRMKVAVFDEALFASDILLAPDAHALDALEGLLELFVSCPLGDYTSLDTAVSALALRAKALKLALIELKAEGAGDHLAQLRTDFAALLYRNGQAFTWEKFVDSYVQIATFGALLWRLESGKEISLDLQVSLKPGIHPLLSQCLAILWSPQSQVEMLRPLLEELCRTINRIPPALFITKPRQPKSGQYVPDAIVHAYEPFFKKYDQAAREANGVYYTPVEIVQQIISGVGVLLRDSMGRPAGLLDEDARFLDPATGTGTFLLGLANEIAVAAGEAGLPTDQVVHEVLSTRTSAFELFPGPYTIAHQRLESLLESQGTPATQRLPIYLADTLAAPESGQLPMPGFGPAGDEILNERKRADWVKTKENILVIVGNPPYERVRTENGGWDVFAADLMQQVVDATPLENRADLKSASDLYVAFWAWALWALRSPEDRQQTSQSPIIKSDTNHGIVAFITNRTWIIGPSLVGLRKLVRTGANEIWVCDLGGDSRGGTGAKSYESGDANVFGIQVGVAIVWLVFDRDRPCSDGPVVHYRRIFGSKAKKLSALAAPFASGSYQTITGEDLFVPVNWPPVLAQADALPALFRRAAFTGLQSARDKSDFSPWSVDRDGVYAEIPGKKGSKGPTRLGNLGRWAELPSETRRRTAWSTAQAKRAKKLVPQPDTLDTKKVRKALYRPLDERYLYDDPDWIDWYRPELHPFYEAGPVPTLVTLPRDFGAGPLGLHTCLLPEQHAFRGKAGGKGVYPLWSPAPGMPDDGRSVVNGRQYNLADTVINWATGVYTGSTDPLLGAYHYILAVLSAPAYADRFWCELEAGPPRIPLAEDVDLAKALAEIGQRLSKAWDKDVPTSELKWEGNGTGPLGRANYAGGVLAFANGRTIEGVPERAWRLTVSLHKVLPEWFAAREHWTATMSQAMEALKTIAAATQIVDLCSELDPLFDRLIDSAV